MTAPCPVPEPQGHHWQTPLWCEQVPLLCWLVDQVPSQHSAVAPGEGVGFGVGSSGAASEAAASVAVAIVAAVVAMTLLSMDLLPSDCAYAFDPPPGRVSRGSSWVVGTTRVAGTRGLIRRSASADPAGGAGMAGTTRAAGIWVGGIWELTY